MFVWLSGFYYLNIQVWDKRERFNRQPGDEGRLLIFGNCAKETSDARIPEQK